MLERYKCQDECSGCGACAAACSDFALEMRIDEEGFRYPFISENCTECGLCSFPCSFQKAQMNRKELDEKINTDKVVYVGRHREENIVENSRSGGIFTALSDYVFENDGIVYGCVLDQHLNVIHICACNKNDRDRMRGSKYVQSIVSADIYDEIRKYTRDGKLVLFSGTSCQVDAVRNYPGINSDNLITMDIVCHGVVSPKIWNLYRSHIEKKAKGKCYDVDFRNKKRYGWREHIETLYIRKEDGGVEELDTSVYRKIFYEHYALRPSCYRCPYKSQQHPADITIGDCWGIESMNLSYDDDKGCSIILVNTDKGQRILRDIMKVLDIKKVKMNPSLFQPGFHVSFQVDADERKHFWKRVEADSDMLFESYR